MKELFGEAVETQEFNQEKMLKVIEKVFVYSEKNIKVIWRFDEYDTNGTLDVKKSAGKEGTAGECEKTGERAGGDADALISPYSHRMKESEEKYADNRKRTHSSTGCA